MGVSASKLDAMLVGRVSTVFALGRTGQLLSARDNATLFQDSAGTTAVTAVEQPVGRILDKSGRGNHATQATTTKRPVLSGRVNLLTKTEQLVDAGWVRSSGVTVETGHVDPLGGATGCLVTIPASGKIYILSADPRGSAVASVYLKLFTGAGAANVLVNSPNGQGYSVNFDPASLQGAWSRLISPPSNTAVRNGFRFLNISASEAKFYAWGASLTLATDAHLPYQRVNTATDYDTIGFPQYTKFDGIDDNYSTAAGGGGNTGIALCLGIQRNASGIAQTLWSDTTADKGYRLRINAANKLELAAGNGAPIATPVQAAPVAATTGGTGLAASTAYFWKVTAANANGETLGSAETTLTTSAGTTDSVTISWAAIAGATKYFVYRGTATGAQNVYYDVGNVTSYVDTGAASTAGSPPALGESAYVKVASVADVPTVPSVLTAWDDGTNMNVQINSDVVASVARPAVSAGGAAITLGDKANINLYSLSYTKNDGLSASDRFTLQRNAAVDAGVVL